MLASQPRSCGVKILGISGSGRTGSFNAALLEAAKGVMPAGATLETYDVTRFPLYNPDLEQVMPEDVKIFKAKLRSADAVLISTPEYNHTISAVMKNAIEWGNRPWGDNSWDGKPVGIMSASSSLVGGARAQEHLRQVMVDLNMRPLNRPQVILGKAQEKFSPDLRLEDERTQELLRDLVGQLVEQSLTARRDEEQAVVVRP